MLTRRGTSMAIHSMDQRITELSARVARLERHLGERSGARRSIWPRALVHRVFPAETRAHLREARRHMWLAARSMIDARIDDAADATRSGREEHPEGA